MGNYGDLHCYTSVRSRVLIVSASSLLVPARNCCWAFTNICRVDYFCKPLEMLHPPPARHMMLLIIPERSDPAAQLEEREHPADGHAGTGRCGMRRRLGPQRRCRLLGFKVVQSWRVIRSRLADGADADSVPLAAWAAAAPRAAVRVRSAGSSF